MHGRPEPKHLLDTLADQNIGNGFILQPQAGGATVVPQSSANSSSYERILMLTGPSSTGQTTSIVLTASRLSGPNNPYPGFPGPITGIIEFGNGGQFTKVEVDIPIGPFVGDFQSATLATEPQDGGVIVTVPTGVLRVYARYDNQLIQAPVSLPSSPSSTKSLAQLNGVSFVGPGGPAIGPGNIIIPPEPVQVKAMAAFFSRHTSKVYRTNYLYVGDVLGTVTIPLVVPPYPPLYPTVSPYFFCIPPFARSLKVLRYNLTTAPTSFPSLTVKLWDNMAHQLETIPVTTSPAPIIPIEGTETIVSVETQNPGDRISFLALCYEIGI